jgi:hypothetical protein
MKTLNPVFSCDCPAILACKQGIWGYNLLFLRVKYCSLKQGNLVKAVKKRVSKTVQELDMSLPYKVRDLSLAPWGRREMDLAEKEMPARCQYAKIRQDQASQRA